MKNQKIYGIDIQKNSPRSKEIPRYSVVITRGRGGTTTYHKMVPLHKIVKMVKKDIPSIIAVDNIYELAENKKDLVRFISKIPESVKLVQVTGGTKKKSLMQLAHEHNISFNRFDPAEEAETCACLAEMGVGCEVSLFEEVTKIKVSRARSLGRGGWSQNRYRRKVHGAIKVKSREIESTLFKDSKDKNYSYTKKVVEGFGGYVRAEFMVNVSKNKVPIRSSSTSDVQVNVKSLERDKIKYLPLKNKHRHYTIVGVDPGTTVGLAVLSLDGDVLHIGSYRSISHDEIVKKIVDFGKPIIIATDVTPTPSSVERVRRSFNAILGSPGGAELSSEDKINLARSFGLEYSNDHERDALSAALYTFKNYRNTFEKIEKKTPYNFDLNEIKSLVIRGESIENALEKTSNSQRHNKLKQKKGTLENSEFSKEEKHKKLINNIKEKDEEINDLMEYVLELKEEIASKDKKIEKLEILTKNLRTEVYKEIKKEKEIKNRSKKISRLKKELKHSKQLLSSTRKQNKRLKKLRKMEFRGEGVPVKIIETFNKESILAVEEKYGINENDVVYFEDSSGGGALTASILIERKVRAVILSSSLISHSAQMTFLKAQIPVLENLTIQRADDLGVVDPDELGKAINKWKEYESRLRAKEEEENLMSMVDEYRSKRKRGLA
ncbi:DUF460 domain-containing protein [Methanosalsum natronophilum]|uniref:DUF460 domain-containing protein n=1 Tax=Methanosalsum natronophilum TaxID=768733 RepID=UPI00216A9810|nr:DUF460 domain-containing protein [Methanosalsum natronophilum]MCS3924858.1 putative RNase H-like nuclease (RuvC/YqgF family) [Methanosalsum natronophilum]